MTFSFKKQWRTTTALCIASTLVVATAAYAANSNVGISDWDKRPHNKNHADNGKSNDGKGNDDKNGHNNDPANSVKTESPLKHVTILIGENRGLDHTFGTYRPKGKGETISNLLSKGIVNEDGTPGPNFAKAQQFSAAGQSTYYVGAPTVA